LKHIFFQENRNKILTLTLLHLILNFITWERWRK